MLALGGQMMKSRQSSQPPAVAAVFREKTAPVQAKLMRLRKLVLDTAAKMDGVAVEETLKWGQPSYLAKGGSTIRIDAAKGDPARVALYFICHTDLIATFRELYPELDYDGNRAILLEVRGKFPEDALRHCISLALSYRKRRH